MILKPCPFCQKPIPRSIQACPYCHRDEQGRPVLMDAAAAGAAEDSRYYEEDLAALGSPDPFQQDQAVVRMARRGFGVVQALISVLGDHDKPGLSGVAKVLGKIGDRRAIGALANAARLGDDDLRHAALWALAQFREPEVTPTLVAEAERSQPAVQSFLAHALGNRQDARAIPALKKLARSAHREVAFQALWSLGEMQDASVAGVLRRHAHSRDPIRRHAARLSLQKLGLRAHGAAWRWIACGAGAAALAAAALFYYR